jgi:hypothetical protein
MLDLAIAARADGTRNDEISLGTIDGKSLVERGGVPGPARTLSEFERLLAKAPPTEFEKLLEKTPSNLRVQRAPAGSAAGIGAVVLVGVSGLNSLAAQAATIETLTGVIELLTSTRFDNGCDRCVRKAMWTQKRKQKKVRGVIRQRQR